MSIWKLMPVAGLLAIVGCSQMEERPMAQPAMPQAAQRETVLEASAVVEKVDQKTREVTLRTTEGERLVVTAGPEVRNLAQVRPRDVVRLAYFESVAVSMAQPGAGGPATTTTAAERAPEGSRPAGAVGAEVDAVVEFVSFDAATGDVTFKTPEGVTQTTTIVDPAIRQFAAARLPGERVAVRLTTAVAVAITKAGG